MLVCRKRETQDDREAQRTDVKDGQLAPSWQQMPLICPKINVTGKRAECFPKSFKDAP